MVDALLLCLTSGKRLHNDGKSPFFMGKSTISMAIFKSYVTNYQRVYIYIYIPSFVVVSNSCWDALLCLPD